MSRDIHLLYVHRYAGRYHYAIVPTGIIFIMNILKCKKLGKFQLDVKKEDIKNTNINPYLKIMLGGYAALGFDKILIKDFAVIRVPIKRALKEYKKFYNLSRNDYINPLRKLREGLLQFLVDFPKLYYIFEKTYCEVRSIKCIIQA